MRILFSFWRCALNRPRANRPSPRGALRHVKYIARVSSGCTHIYVKYRVQLAEDRGSLLVKYEEDRVVSGQTCSTKQVIVIVQLIVSTPKVLTVRTQHL